jgi:hypothetical protein
MLYLLLGFFWGVIGHGVDIDDQIGRGIDDPIGDRQRCG